MLNIESVTLSEIQCGHYSCPSSLDLDREPRHALYGHQLDKVGRRLFPTILTEYLYNIFNSEYEAYLIDTFGDCKNHSVYL